MGAANSAAMGSTASTCSGTGQQTSCPGLQEYADGWEGWKAVGSAVVASGGRASRLGGGREPKGSAAI